MPQFKLVRRGYDPSEVDGHIAALQHTIDQLGAGSSPPAAVRDALEKVGDEVTGILQHAHQTAAEVTSAAQSEADRVIAHAAAEAEELTAAAQTRLQELDLETESIWGERDRLVSDIRELARQLVQLADAATARFPPAEDEEPATEAPAPAEGEEPATEAPAPAEGEEPATEAPAPAEGEEPATEALRLMRAIDCLHLGNERVICCWQVGDVLIDPGPSSCLPTLLDALGDERPRALLLTHIHLDHAGASGSLVRRWPDLEVYVHERGARHMADPARLLDSATRLYGDDMERLWGEFVAVPQERLHVLSGGEQLRFGDDGEFEVAYTPGHASHHVSYLHDGTAFVGDVGGVRITPDAPVIPPTPPPDIDVEAWHRSLALISDWAPDRLAMTHFGSSEAVAEQLADVGERLDRWAVAARDNDEPAWTELVRHELREGGADTAFPAYMQAVPTDQAYAGLRRYWQKRAQAVS
jgi:glyoxylase-like metal-dependent hydrolase (beta-lactamase superfamily II)/cell division septum initiation protein DivIVA